MPSILLQLSRPYLTPIEADELRAEIVALNPKVHLVLADWPWLEVRGITEKGIGELLEKLKMRDVKFRVLEAGKKTAKAKVQVSETLTVC